VPYETILASATRLGAPGSISALLRCGGVEWSAGGMQRAFSTPQYVLCYLASGTGSYRDTQGRSWRWQAGDVFQRFPDARHDVQISGSSRWWYVAVPAAILTALRQLGLPTLDTPVFTIGLDPQLATRYAALARRLRDAPEDDLGLCLSAMVSLMVEVHRRAAPLRATLPHRARIEAACRLIRAAPTRRPRPVLLAREIGMGYHAFRKAFARHHGCGVAAWALRQRLLIAQELLADRELTVAEVAARIGYEDPLQFSTIFRRHFGVSPRLWRRGA
jgi:AraC-like DNA-binding protein